MRALTCLIHHRARLSFRPPFPSPRLAKIPPSRLAILIRVMPSAQPAEGRRTSEEGGRQGRSRPEARIQRAWTLTRPSPASSPAVCSSDPAAPRTACHCLHTGLCTEVTVIRCKFTCRFSARSMSTGCRCLILPPVRRSASCGQSPTGIGRSARSSPSTRRVFGQCWSEAFVFTANASPGVTRW